MSDLKQEAVVDHHSINGHEVRSCLILSAHNISLDQKADCVLQVDEKNNVVDVKVVIGDEAFQQAMIKDPPRPWSKNSILLYLVCVVGFCCSTTNGYDGSLFSTLLANEAFKGFFHVSNAGSWTGGHLFFFRCVGYKLIE